jgi:hypothetical protein
MTRRSGRESRHDASPTGMSVTPYCAACGTRKQRPRARYCDGCNTPHVRERDRLKAMEAIRFRARVSPLDG